MPRFLIPTLAFSFFSPSLATADDSVAKARESAEVASVTLSKVQRWLHEVALPKVDPETHLYISHNRGSARYRNTLWNYDDAAADTYPFLFWAAWYTDHDKIKGPVLDVLVAEQKHCNLGDHPQLPLGRIPTAVNHKTLEKVIKSKDNTVFAAMEYVKDGLIPIVEIAGTDNPWFQRMRDIVDDIWKHADIDTPYGKITTKNLEANGEMLQALPRLYCATGEKKYLDWAIRLADYYLLPGDFLPKKLRDHGCEILGGLGLLYAVLSEEDPEKAREYDPHLRKMYDQIIARGTNEDGLMFNAIGSKRGLSDGWGYNYVGFLSYDLANEESTYDQHITQLLRNLGKKKYRNGWGKGVGGNMDEVADSVEGGLYLINHHPVPEAIAWADHEVIRNIVRVQEPDHMWTAYKLQSNGVRTAIQHALMHTRGCIARPWRQDLQLGGHQDGDRLTVVLKAEEAWEGKLFIDKPRHRLEMGFSKDWPRMNMMPEWFVAEPDENYVVEDLNSGAATTQTGAQLHAGLPVTLDPGKEKLLLIRKQ